MGRIAAGIPKKHRTDGVWYYPDIDDNQKIWREYVELRSKWSDEHSTISSQLDRLRELEQLLPGLFAVRIGPYSFDEQQKIEAGSRKKLTAHVDRKTGKVEFEDNPIALGEEAMFDICAARIFEVANYTTTEAEVDANGDPVLDAEGEIVTKTKEIRTGKELVKFIREEAELDEKAVLDDIFLAIKHRSHLEPGQKKTYPSQPTS